MLNEIREFEQYQEVFTDLKDIEKYRLMPYSYFKQNHKNGLRRAMTIVARKALEERGYFRIEDVIKHTEEAEIDEQKKIIEQVKNDLRIWCGFETPDGQTSIQPWLNHFYNLSCQKNKKYETWEAFRRFYDSAFSTGIFSTTFENDKNSIYAISYEGIIADAISLGGLKRYYLVCKPNEQYPEMNQFKVENSDKSGYRPFKRGKKNKGKDDEKMDCIRKFVAAYLLKQRTTKLHNSYNIVNNADLANWTHNATIFKVEFFNKIRYKEKPIYEREAYWDYNIDENTSSEEKAVKNNKKLQKCRPCPQYLKDYNFYIVSEEEFDKEKLEKNGEIFYSDMGSYINDGKKHCFLCEGLEYKDMSEKYSIKC